MSALLQWVHAGDGILRGRDPAPGAGWKVATLPLSYALVCGLGYGAAMGAYGLAHPDGGWQMLYSGLKVPLLLLVAYALSLPLFFVLNTLLGLRDDFGEAFHAVSVTQAALTLILLALAPYTLLWYASYGGYDGAIVFNGAMFAVASLSAQHVLRRQYRPLIRRHPRHAVMLKVWLGAYVFIAIQMAWTLRPFIGRPGLPVQFFREGAWEGNAYVEVGQKIWGFFQAL